jgi:Ni/Fe-hydrogenase subunit HybB-like protein
MTSNLLSPANTWLRLRQGQESVTGPVMAVLAAAAAGLIISLAVAFANLMVDGHAAFNTSSSGVTWGLPVVNYVFFALASTGLTMVASLALVFGIREFYPIAKRCVWLSIAAIVAGFASLALELGHPFRMLWAIPLNFQYQSPLMWMGLFYLAFLVLGVVKFAKIHGGDWDSRGSRVLGIAALTAEILAALTLGAAFGMMGARPVWSGAEVPLNFLVTAATTGAAFAVLITHIAYGSMGAMPVRVRSVMSGPMPRVLAAAVAVFFLMTLYRSIAGLWSNVDGLQVWNTIVLSPWYWMEMAGLMIAFWLLVTPTRASGARQVVAALLTLLAVFIARYEFVIGGQLVPMFKGTWVQGLVQYTPSTTEWMLAVMAVSITFLVYAVGERMFDLAAEPAKA